MDAPPVCILQLSDSLTLRKAALRLYPGDDSLPLGALLDKYLKDAPISQLLRESRITQDSADALFSLQDLAYSSDDGGRLMDLFDGTAFTDLGSDGAPFLDLNERPAPQPASAAGQEISLLDIGIDRTYVTYARNWRGFHARKWTRDPDRYAGFVRQTLEAAHGPARAAELLPPDSGDGKLDFLKTLALAVWDSPFENYSRFTGKKLVCKSGDETIDNIMAGAGAVCSEKVQALKFLTDHYGFESEYLIAGPGASGPVPVEKLRELLTTFDFRFAKRYMRYWQHTALLYRVDGTPVLVDATNGNIPFLFLTGADAERILGGDGGAGQPVTARMVERPERFYYHRTPQDIPENLFFALEGWMPFSDLMQVFDNELGLSLSADFYVMPLPYRTEKQYRQDGREYLEAAKGAGLECSLTPDWTLDTPAGRAFAEAEPTAAARVMESEEHLLARLDECDGRGHKAGLAVMKLRPETGPPVFPSMVGKTG